MELKDAIKLIEGLGEKKTKEIWADLGCGSGLFTYALAHLLPSESLIYAVDKSSAALEKFPNPNLVTIQKQQLDFINELSRFKELDGILMANSLHFVRDKITFLSKLRPCLKTRGQLLLVEYNTDVSNHWVPYPTGYKTLKALLEKHGFSDFTKLSELPSRYQKGNMYSAIGTIN